MTSANIHVNAVNEANSIAEVEETMRRASAAVQEATLDEAGVQAAQRNTQSDIEAIGPDMALEASGMTSASIVKTVVESVSEGRNDPAASADAQEMVDLGLAEQPTSFDKIAPLSEIETDFQGPTFTEQFNMVENIFEALNKDMSGATANEAVVEEMTEIANIKQTMAMVNERVMVGAQHVLNNAPTYNGPGGHQMSIADRAPAQNELNMMGRMESQPFASFKAPELGLNNMAPKPPTSNMLTEEEGS